MNLSQLLHSFVGGLSKTGRSWRLGIWLGLFLPAISPASPWIWWEAENSDSSNFPASTWLSPSSQADRDVLSGGNLLVVQGLGPQTTNWANYTVPVAQAGTYRLYARRTAEYAPFKWQFDTGAGQYASDQLAGLDSVNYKPYWPVNWFFLGTVTLDAGPHAFHIVFSGADWPGNPNYANGGGNSGLDAFILTTDPNYIPRGKLQPGQKYGLAEPGKWDFEPGTDGFTPSALVDLRSLNEAVAGQSGYVHRAADGSGRVVLGDGTPVRFWGAVLGNTGLDLGSLTTQARFLAKRGVNLVRYQSRLPACDPANIHAVDASFVDNAQRIVAACKQAGIYTQLNYFWSAAFTLRGAWGVPGYTNDVAGPGPVLMFDDTLKAAYKQWATQLLTTPSPYTGIPLAQDPALAVIEIQNEDNFFWWWDPNNLPKPQLQNLEAKFGAYLIAKYGSIAAAQAGWQGLTQPDDDPANGRMGLIGTWYMTTALTDGWFVWYTSRMADETAFLADLQRAFYKEMGDFLRNTLGCRCLIGSGNWTTVQDRYLLDVDHYTYTPNDVIDEHRYFQGPNLDQAFYGVNVGDCDQSISAVSNPRQLPCAYKEVAGYLNMASESSWVNPNRFKAEGPLLIAAYNSLADVGAWIWDATGPMAYDDSEEKWPFGLPSLMGQFPGAALLYRRGDVQTQLAVHEERNLNRAYQKQAPLVSQSISAPNEQPPYTPPYDPVTRTGRLDPLAMLTGRVECKYVFQDGSNYVAPNVLSQIDTARQVVESLPPPGATHGQLKLDWSNAVFQVNTLRSQGICGFLSHFPSVDLNDVTIVSTNDFGAVLVIALDDLPIAQSHKILIQAVTEDNPYGFQDQDTVFTNSVDGLVYSGKKIVSVGQPPMNVVNIAGTVTLKGLGQGRSFRAVILDENGYIKADASSQALGSNLLVMLPPNALYTVLLDTAGLTVPSFTSQPQGQVVDPGTSVQFSAGAAGSPPLAYQWLFNGLPLDGATSSTLTLPGVAAADNGNYSVSVVNWVGSATSAVAVLTVKAPPVVSQQPQNTAANSGTNITFTVTALGTGPLSYQWLLEGTALGGATASSLVLSNVQSGDTGNYFVIVSNQFGPVVSSNALLLVGLPATYLQADIGNPTHHGSAQISFDSAGQEVISVNGGGTDIWGASDSFHFYYTTRTGPFDCRVRVRNLTGPDWWSKVELMARESTGAGARFFANMATTASGQNQVWVQWRDTTGGGAGSPTAPTPTITPNNPNCWLRLQRVGNVFYVSYSSDNTSWNRYYTWDTSKLGTGVFANKLLVGLAVTAHNTTDTNGATAVCSDFQFDPMVTTQPRNLTVLAGQPASLKVTASGTTALTYQWWCNSVRVTGATNATLTFTNVQPAQAGTYCVVVSDAAGTETSANAVLTVNVPTTITMQPQSQTANVGATVAFSLTATGTAPLTYQWQFNGANLSDNDQFSGSQSNQLVLAGVLLVNAGDYRALIAGQDGSATSAVAHLTVLPGVPILNWPSPAPITYGSALSSNQLNATASLPGSFAYSPHPGTVLDAGTNIISVIFTPDDAVNFLSSTSHVALVVLPAPLTITAANTTRLYGDPNPVFGGTIAGLMNGDIIGATYSTTATAASPVGIYSILPSPTDPAQRLRNYAVSLSHGCLTITPAPLHLTANNASRQYGQTNPPFAGTISGLVNGDVVTLAFSTLATPASPVGTYPIVPGAVDPGLKLGNYTLCLTNGVLSVTPAALVLAAADATRQYGQTNPPFTGTISGLVNGENLTALYACSATPASPPGPYPIVPTLVDPANLETNYTVSLVDGKLTVTSLPAPVMLSVAPASGPTNGDTLVSLIGANFQSGATVSFGSLPAASVMFINSTNLTVVTPPQGAGVVDVRGANPDGQSAVLTNAFTFKGPGPPPAIQATLASDGTITITWNSAPGQTYQLQSATDLGQADWSAQGAPIVAANSTVSVSAVLDLRPQVFFRVLLLP